MLSIVNKLTLQKELQNSVTKNEFWTKVKIQQQQNKTRRVLSETKAIMSLPVCHWMESIFFVEEGELIN